MVVFLLHLAVPEVGAEPIQEKHTALILEIFCIISMEPKAQVEAQVLDKLGQEVLHI